MAPESPKPFSMRLGERTMTRLETHGRRRGETRTRTGERLIEEGLRTADHPGIVFRDGPSGRRAALAVVERPDLRDVGDLDLFAVAQCERRAAATENVADYVPIANEHDARAQAHHGLVLVHPATHARGNARTVGTMVSTLDALARRFGSDEPTSLRTWL